MTSSSKNTYYTCQMILIPRNQWPELLSYFIFYLSLPIIIKEESIPSIYLAVKDASLKSNGWPCCVN